MTQSTVFIPRDRSLKAGAISTLLARYAGKVAVHWDDSAHTRTRRASITNGSIAPTPHYDAPTPDNPADFNDAWRAAHLDGHTKRATKPKLFEGIRTL